jgi:hypothetical protein
VADIEKLREHLAIDRCSSSVGPGVAHFPWHTPRRTRILRHAFCSHLVMQGARMRDVQELVGYQHLTMTQRYSHLTPAALPETIGLLDRRPVTRPVETVWRRRWIANVSAVAGRS